MKEKAERLFEKSIKILRLLCFENGAIIAAPTSYGYCTHIWKALDTPALTPESLGYHFVWVRDGTYMAMALDATGNHEHAEKFYEWCMQVQDHSGCWLQCYWPDGRRAINSLEMDQVGTQIFGVYNHYLLTKDMDFMFKTWPMTKRAADFLVQNLSANGLINPSFDLWEERWGHHLYSNAASAAGLFAASRHAELLGEWEWKEKWEKTAQNLRIALIERFLHPKKGVFVRSINPLDGKADISVLGLVFPFSLVSPMDVHMMRTVKEIEEKLVGDGGVMRYLGDKYDGVPEHKPWTRTKGNFWVSATLWLALYHLEVKEWEKAERHYNWVVDKATEDCFLPQQIDSRGKPCSAVPYGLAHALFILATLKIRENSCLNPQQIK